MKTFSEPMRRLDPRGAVTCVVDKRRHSCYRGWFLRWTELSTRRQGWIYAGETVDDAKARKRALERREADGLGSIEEVTFEHAADEFLRWKRSELAPPAYVADKEPKKHTEEPTAWLQELHRILVKLKAGFKGRILANLEPYEIEAYFAKRGGGPRAKNADLGILRGLFRYGRKHYWLRTDPTEGLKKWKMARRGVRLISAKEEAGLLAACTEEYKVSGIEGARNKGSIKGGVSETGGKAWTQSFAPPPWLAPLVLLALKTCLRMSSLRRLEWRHIDLKKNVIRIRGEETKNAEDLEIPLHPEARAVLVDLRHKAAKVSPIPLRVLDASGAPVPDRRAVARAFSAAVERAKLNPPIRFHGIRKVGATRMLQAGVDLKTVAAIGGWRDPRVLLSIYAGTTEKAKRAAVAKL